MGFSVIDSNAEDLLYASLLAEGHAGSAGTGDVHFLQCQFFHLGEKASLSDIQEILSDIKDLKDCSLYLCTDGDVIIRWVHNGYDVRNHIAKAMEHKFGDDIRRYMKLEDFFLDYDVMDAQTRLRAECAKKLKKQTKQAKELAKYFVDERLIAALARTINLTKMQRSFRGNPHILIVEDQIFSQKMLTSILKDYTCHVAENAGEALLMYMEKCPDIVLLDIELPDLSGHRFANLVNRIDTDAYVIMVSANRQEADIKTARSNQVKGFITKPYEKERILEAIDQFKKQRKKQVA
ncbi:MAG: response regulator [Alphaproteobacteria bacterium]|nr:response regulator [Alphaproteobacteria bacterium]MCD8570492.1 response regulator [Alphaproteobacteria bacterium]